MGYQQTQLWQMAFETNNNDEYSESRSFLKNQLLSMRGKVSQLISGIPADCKDLTVHDITHLDALWETAQLISGDDWKLNPAEAFVFGAAALIHDAALTTLAYPGGKKELQSTQQWTDLSASYFSPLSKTDNDTSKKLDDVSESFILFEVLRRLHAEQASVLCTQSWDLQGGGSIYLIEDCELRESFGVTIGRIARSHHWDSERLQYDLKAHMGGSPRLPQDWTINEIKLACLLRCADAAQIDRTRAPIMLYAALGPKGHSDAHWKAQLKLNRPLLKKDSIYFTSSSSYSISESDAWWVTFDLAKILDKELRASNAILTNIEENTFAAQRVAGIDSARTFSNYVQTNKWHPIDASIRITDPLHIAKTLGGKNLYGSSTLVPFRELIQNATDAIRARRYIEKRRQDFGTIQITIEPHPQDSDMCLLHIDDNGIGMSERVLCTTLVDFGKSFWTSNLVLDEFPGLRGAQINHIGQFGIGFFSIFELSQDVTVTSRRFDLGHNEIKTLKFRGLITRPLLCEASPQDIPRDFNTRITACIRKTSIQQENIIKDEMLSPQRSRAPWRAEGRSASISLKSIIMSICAFIDVEVKFTDILNGDSFIHTPNIYEKSTKEFIEELMAIAKDKNCYYFSPETQVQPIKSADGDTFGRAALDIDCILKKRMQDIGYISIGGIATFSNGYRLSLDNTYIPYYGIITGKTERAARDIARACLPETAIRSWLKNQVDIIDKEILKKSEIMQIASFAFSSGISTDLPYAFHQGNTVTISELTKIISTINDCYIPINWRFDAWPEIIGYNELRPEYFETSLAKEVIVLAYGSDRILDEDDAKAIKKMDGKEINGSQVMSTWGLGRIFFNFLRETWATELKFEILRKPIFSTKILSLTQERWVLAISKLDKHEV